MSFMNSNHTLYLFRHLACILLLLIFGTEGATAQRFQGDSIFADAEIEDSLGLLSIKPVTNPKKVIKECMEQLKADFKQKHSKRQYMLKEIEHHNEEQTSILSQMLTIENDNGITLGGSHKSMEWSSLMAEVPYPMAAKDSSKAVASLRADCIPKFNLLRHYGKRNAAPSHLDIEQFYKMEVYSIGNDSGRGVYRINLVQRYILAIGAPLSSTVRFYFDQQSLRLMQYRQEIIMMTGLHGYYKYDYGEEDGSPVLTRGQWILVDGSWIQNRCFIQRIEDK